MKTTLIPALVFLLAVWGCTPETTSIAPDLRPVVAAYLVAGQPFLVSVTRQIPFTTDTTSQGQPIDGLMMSIKSGDQTISLKPAGNGVYRSDATVTAQAGKSYQLVFAYLGQSVSGTTVMPTRPANVQQDQTELYRTAVTLGNGVGQGVINSTLAASATLTWNNPTADYYYVVVDNIETVLLPIVTNRNGGTVSRRFRTQPTQGSSTTIPALTFEYFGRHRLVLYHLNPDYAALYKQNSTSTQNISTPATTVVNGLGIFTGMNTDTLYITVKPQ